MPLDDRMHPHEPRPASIRNVEPASAQLPPVWIRPARAHEDGFDAGVAREVLREGFFHGPSAAALALSCHLGVSIFVVVVGGVDVESEVVFVGGSEGEGGYGVEGVRGRDVDCGEGGGEGWVGGEEGEVED